MYYFCTSLNKDGHSPSQEELDAGINALRDFPGPRTYNIALWQPHLAGPKVVDDLSFLNMLVYSIILKH